METKTQMIEEIKSFLQAYGWHFREQTTANGKQVVVTNYRLSENTNGILLSLRVQGEFVIVSSEGFLTDVPLNLAGRILNLNDTIKLVKLYSVNQKKDKLNVEIGFELWGESWNKKTFFAFMDMLCLGIEDVLKKVKLKNIPHKTKFVTYQ